VINLGESKSNFETIGKESLNNKDNMDNIDKSFDNKDNMDEIGDKDDGD